MVGRTCTYLLLAMLLFIVGCETGSCRAQPVSVSEPQELASNTPLFLDIESPETLELVVDVADLTITGKTRQDALLTVGDAIIEPDIEGRFMHKVVLNVGHNVIEILASSSSGENRSEILAIIFTPRG